MANHIILSLSVWCFLLWDCLLSLVVNFSKLTTTTNYHQSLCLSCIKSLVPYFLERARDEILSQGNDVVKNSLNKVFNQIKKVVANPLVGSVPRHLPCHGQTRVWFLNGRKSLPVCGKWLAGKNKKRKVVMSTVSNSTSIFIRGDNLIGHCPKGVRERFVTVLCWSY